MRDNTSHGNVADAYDERAVAAIFDSLEQAKDAARDLHDAGFHGTWVGVVAVSDDYEEGDGTTGDAAIATDHVTRAGSENTVRTAAGGGFGASLARFFGEENHKSLVEALMDRGIPWSDAAALDRLMTDGGAVLTVDVGDDYDLVVRSLRNDGGMFTDRNDPAMGGRRPSDAASTTNGEPGGSATLQPDENETLQLREERLRIDKQRVSAGAVTVSKRVVGEARSVDVPVSHDELFISRRRILRDTSASGPIRDDETITIPLMRDRVVVDKRAYVTEEVRLGKRSVAGTQRIDDRVRREELVVENDRELANDRDNRDRA